MEKNFLFILSKAPFSSASAKESADAIMATCAFGQQVTILALDDGLYQFTKQQDPSLLQLKNTASMLESLPMYGTEQIVVTEEDLASKQLTEKDFVLPIIKIHQAAISDKISHADIVLNY